MIRPDQPALVLAPMDGITDAAMREVQGEFGAFTYGVTEFVRVANHPIPPKTFRRDIPELVTGGTTSTGLPVQVQLLGGNPERMAESAVNAVESGAKMIDINFGCPAPTVNRNDGGASLLREPARIRELVHAVRSAVPSEVPVSAKLRLGWESIEDVFENAAKAAEGGAAWLTIHARTKVQGYNPPVFWPLIGRLREELHLPIVANGDIWTLEDFRQCQQETGASHYMLGRGALANPSLGPQVAYELGLAQGKSSPTWTWPVLLNSLAQSLSRFARFDSKLPVMRLKQWLSLASRFGGYPYFDLVKRIETVDEFLARIDELHRKEDALS